MHGLPFPIETGVARLSEVALEALVDSVGLEDELVELAAPLGTGDKLGATKNMVAATRSRSPTASTNWVRLKLVRTVPLKLKLNPAGAARDLPCLYAPTK